MKAQFTVSCFIFSFWLCLPVFGQTLQPSKITVNGQLKALVKDGNTLYLGGQFTGAGYKVSGVARIPVGTDFPDPGFPVAFDGEVNAMIPDGNGGWYVGGNFSRVNGVNKSRLVRVHTNGEVDSNFSPAPSGSISALVLDNGILYAGGNFSSIGGAGRNSLAAISPVSGAALPWSPAMPANSWGTIVNSIAIAGDTLIATGNFDSVNNIRCPGFVQISKTTGNVIPVQKEVFGSVSGCKVYGDTIYLYGHFDGWGKYKRNYAKVDTITGNPIPSIELNGVFVSVPDNNGGWYVGGGFDSIGGTNNRNLAHILPDGTVDTSFSPDPTGVVYALALDSNRLYVGGDIHSIGGSTLHQYLAAVDPINGAVSVWSPNVNGVVRSLAIYGNAVVIGGSFTSVGGQSRSRLAIVDKFSAAVGTFSVPVGGNEVRMLKISGNTLYVIGNFNSIMGAYRSGIASIDLTTYSLNTFNPIIVFNPGATGPSTMYLDSNAIFVGGGFWWIGGQQRNGIAKIDRNTGNVITGWNANLPATSGVGTIQVVGSKVYFGGFFAAVGGDIALANLAAVDKNSAMPYNWKPSPSHSVGHLWVNEDWVYFRGAFTHINLESSSSVIAFSRSSQNIVPFSSALFSGSCNCVQDMIKVNGYLYVAGSFNSVGGQARTGLAKINATTGLTDTSWNAHLAGAVSHIHLKSSTLYLDGVSAVGGIPRQMLAAVDLTTGLPTFWNPQADKLPNGIISDANSIYLLGGGLYSTNYLKYKAREGLLAIDCGADTITNWDPNGGSSPGGHINCIVPKDSLVYIGGDFSNVGGQQRNRIAALHKGTGIATAWNPDANGSVLTLHTDGAIVYAGGAFTQIGGQPRSKAAALSMLTGSATAWNPGISQAWGITVNRIIASTDRIFVAGAFSVAASQPRNNIACFDKLSGNLTSWNPNVNGPIHTMELTSGLVYIGGTFTTVSGQPRPRLASISRLTGFATAWNPAPNSVVNSLAVRNDRVFIGGNFTQVSGQNRQKLVMLNAHTGLSYGWSPSFTDKGYPPAGLLIRPQFSVPSGVVDGRGIKECSDQVRLSLH